MRLLLVEDEALQREMLAGHLQARGYVVYSVGSAEEALDEVQAHRVDIVLADFRLPGRSGLDLVEQLRNVNPEVAFVMMTAYATVDVAVQAMKTGAVDFVTKPLELDTLDAVLARVGEGRRLVAENERLRRRLAQLETSRTFLGVSFEFRKVIDLA
jgi:two-component system NtrC family response regulator